MNIGKRNSLVARTEYRLMFLVRRIKNRLNLQYPAVETSLPRPSGNMPDPRVFVSTHYGSGKFGRWVLDEYDLPAYEYEMNQYIDNAATYPVSRGAFSRDHWHQIGNDRINALASNDGTVQFYIADRGGMFLNRVNEGELISPLGGLWELVKVLARTPGRILRSLFLPDRHEVSILASLFAAFRLPLLLKELHLTRLLKALHIPNIPLLDDQQDAYGGGFGYVSVGGQTWSTAYGFHPSLRSNSRRVFGMGYFMTAVQNDPIKVVRRVYAPAGNVPALLADVELTNTCQEEVKLFYYEYWDINIEQQVFQAFRSGILGSIGDSDRRILNRNFKPSIRWDDSGNALRFHLHPPEDSPSPSIPDEVCWLPPDVFLADLSGTPDRKYVDKRHFFGRGGAEKPDAIGKEDNDGISHVNDTIMPYCMVLRREVRLQAGKSARLRFAYGTLDPDFIMERLPTGEQRITPAPMPPDWKQQFQQGYHLDDAVTNSFQVMLDAWKQRLAYFTAGSEPHLQREMAWHAYYLQSSTTYSQFFRSRIVPQGSVYLYGHGIDGVPRDHALFTLPLTYLNPHLSRDMLDVIMQMTSGIGGQIAYSYKGNGALTDALVHKTPSDIDLFFLLAMTEYLAATGDMGFLNAQVPFYPGRNHPQDRTVLNHIRVAWDHLIDEVGVGDNNLIRVLDGDWSDDVVLKNVFPAGILTSPLSLLTSPGQTVEKGESVLNSQMALVILPGIAKLLASQPPSAAQDLGRKMLARLETLMPQLEKGIKAQWQEKGRFYARAILRYWWGGERVLHKNQLDLEGQVWALIGQLEPDRLQALAHSVFEQCDKRSPIGALLASNQVWPAISQLLTWGYTRCDPELAWRSFVHHTLATKAEVYGDCWINIWTGPDGVNGPGNDNPGGTYETAPVTPMTDFPAMNNNQHAMALLALLRVCGIEPSESGDGLCITPRVLQQYTLDLPLLRLELAPGHIRGVYHAHNAGTRCLYVRVREHPTTTQITVNGNTQIATSDKEGFVTITLPPFQEGDHIPFEVAEVIRPAARDTGNLATV